MQAAFHLAKSLSVIQVGPVITYREMCECYINTNGEEVDERVKVDEEAT
jgi:hypothetical protein